MPQLNEYNLSDLLKLINENIDFALVETIIERKAYNNQGFTLVTDGTLMEGNWSKIQVLKNATMSQLSGENITGDFNGVKFPEGITIEGRFTTFKMKSPYGAALLHHV